MPSAIAPATIRSSASTPRPAPSLAAIRPRGIGDVGISRLAWRIDDDLPTVCSPVCNGRLVISLTSGGILTCCDALGGQKLWQKDYTECGRSFEASPVLAGDRLYLIDSESATGIVKADRQFGSLGQCELGEPCIGASFALAPGRIYIRGEKRLFCIGR